MKVFDVIKYEGGNDVLVWKFPGEDFNTLSQLIVHESQEALFFRDGVALDLFGPGRYTMHSQNIPLVRRLVNLPFNGESPFHCEVYFINKVVMMDLLWGTSSPITIQDALYKIMLPVRANGQFAVKVSDSKKFVIGLVGTVSLFNQEILKKYFRGILLTNIKDAIAKQFADKKVSFLEIHAHLKEISIGIENDLIVEFQKYGIELINFNVNEIVPPEDDPSYMQLKRALAKKAEMSVIGYDYQQKRAFDVLDKAAENEGTGATIMGAGMGLGMGVNVGNAMGGLMGAAIGNVNKESISGGVSVETNTIKNQDTAVSMIKCPRCGENIPKDSKFCFNCGMEIVTIQPKSDLVTCPKCGRLVPKRKFCFECGAKLELICGKCGAKLIEGAKFCFECGQKVGE